MLKTLNIKVRDINPIIYLYSVSSRDVMNPGSLSLFLRESLGSRLTILMKSSPNGYKFKIAQAIQLSSAVFIHLLMPCQPQGLLPIVRQKHMNISFDRPFSYDYVCECD